MLEQEAVVRPRRAVYRTLLEGIGTKSACVGVVGLGYVGLPLAAAFGKRGFPCIGIEVDRRKCESLKAGRSYVPDVPSEAVRELVESGRLMASDDYSALCGADAIIICVPTPVYRDKRPDLRDVLRAGEAIGRVLGPGQLVVLESTCYPGTTEDLLRPLLERESGLRAGDDFWLAFSPERIDPGNQRFGLSDTPKVVGGIDAESAEAAAALYSQIVPEVVTVSSAREAEMSKLIENTFRHVNIALANELALIAERLGIDFWEAVRAASSKPFGFMPFYPGPGVAGHCIPVDPHYLAWKAREHEMPCRLIDTAEHINAAMPRRVVERVVEEINNRGLSTRGAHVLVLGVSYKKGISDVRESPALRVIELLEAKGAVVSYHDPYVPALQWNGSLLRSVPLSEDLLSSQACAVLVTDHDYDLELVLNACPLLIDTRNAVKQDVPNCVRLWGKRRYMWGKSRYNGHPALSATSPLPVPYDRGALAEAQQQLAFPEAATMTATRMVCESPVTMSGGGRAMSVALSAGAGSSGPHLTGVSGVAEESALGPGERPAAMEPSPGEPIDSPALSGDRSVTSPAAGGLGGRTGLTVLTTRVDAQSMAAALPEWPTTRDEWPVPRGR